MTNDDPTSASTRVLLGPVGWLLGPELIAQLKKILRKRSDPRDWMPYYRGCVHDECWSCDGKLVRIIEGENEGGTPGEVAESSAERIVAPDKAPSEQQDNDLWFDYLADCGDASDSMYAVAYASFVSFDGHAATAETWGPGTDHHELTPARFDAEGTLKRGHFLFIGGDTAYHVADGATLRARVEQPFAWAFEDAKTKKHVDPDAKAATCTRRIYGIPGNHDWYDNLEGFSLVFRIGSGSAPRAERKQDPIQLPQLERVQLASYVAIQLPYGWQLWGLDLDSPLDGRQQAYFESLAKPLPDRLIIATPSPAIVFGANIANEHHVAGTNALGIPVPTIPIAPETTVKPRYRLDLSGDVHHYARYYPREGVREFGSVVSGLGGAFHHPTFTRATCTNERVEPIREYPTPACSREQVGKRLLSPASTWIGSYARILPFALTVICGFAATYSVGGRWLLDQLLGLLPGFDVTAPGDGGQLLLHATCALGVFGVAVGGVVLATVFARHVYQHHVDVPGSARNVIDLLRNRRTRPTWFCELFSVRRSFWFAWTIGGVLAAPFILFPLWGPSTPALGLDIAILVIVIALPVAGAVVGWVVAAKDLACVQRIPVAVLGFAHAGVQVATAILFARLVTAGWLAAVGAAVAAMACAALPLRLVRPLFARTGAVFTVLFVLATAVVVTVSLAIVVVAARPGHVISESWKLEAARYALAGVAAMPLGTTWFIWYLAIAARLDAHNNEVGGAARVTRYRELIRFHVHREGITGYVIAIETEGNDHAAHRRGDNLAFKLIDVFTVAAPPPAVERSHSTDIGGLELGLQKLGDSA